MTYKVIVIKHGDKVSVSHRGVVKEMDDGGVEGELYAEFDLGHVVLACIKESNGRWWSQEGIKHKSNFVWTTARTQFIGKN